MLYDLYGMLDAIFCLYLLRDYPATHPHFLVIDSQLDCFGEPFSRECFATNWGWAGTQMMNLLRPKGLITKKGDKN